MLTATRLMLTLIVIALSTPAMAQDALIDWKKGGKWPQLAEHIGTYDFDKILADKGVKAELDKMFEGRDVDLNAQFAVHGSIGFENDCLLLLGNEQNKGDTNRAYMEVCIAQGNVNLALYDNGKITVFTKLGDYQYLNEGMKQWIYLQSVPFETIETKPADLQLVTQAE